MATHQVRVDYTKSLVEEPETGHNRWHPDIPPVVRCEPGDEVVLETRDAFDGQMGPDATLETVAGPNLDVVPPAHRPGVRQGRRAGRPARGRDPRRRAGPLRLHRAGPGLRLPARRVPRPVQGPAGTSPTAGRPLPTCPGVRIPGSPFMGTIGLAPDRALLERTIGARAGRARPRRVRAAARPRRRRAGRPGHRRRGAAHDPAPGDRPATSTSSSSARGARLLHPGRTPTAACSPPATPTSPRATARPAAPPSRCARPCASASPSTRAEAAAPRHPRPPVRPRRLLPAARVRRAAPVLRHHRALGHPRRREPPRGPHPGRPQRPAQHDRAPPGPTAAGPASRPTPSAAWPSTSRSARSSTCPTSSSRRSCPWTSSPEGQAAPVTSWVSRVAVAKSGLTRFLVSPKASPVAVSPKAKLPPTPPIPNAVSRVPSGRPML